jgi:hypothetical protein
MKQILAFFLAITSIAAYSQTADEIVAAYSKNMGGLEAFQAIKTAKMTGIVTAQGMDLPLTMVIINKRAARTDVDVMGQTITSSYLDGKGWKLNPLQGVNEPTDMEAAELSEAALQSRLANTLMDYKAQGNTIELLGTESVGAAKAYKIKLTSGTDQKVTIFYIDSSNYTLLKTVASRELMGQSVEVVTEYSDLKQFGDVKFFTSRTQSANGNVFQVITLSKIDLNVPVDEKAFGK